MQSKSNTIARPTRRELSPSEIEAVIGRGMSLAAAQDQAAIWENDGATNEGEHDYRNDGLVNVSDWGGPWTDGPYSPWVGQDPVTQEWFCGYYKA